MQRLDYTIMDLLESTAKNIKAQPINLGGVSGPAGGAGGPPGGFIGYLPQTRVAYDEDEIASSGITGSGTLLDNLNHIRYRLNVVESGVLVVDESDGIPSISNVSRITFSGSATVTDMGGGRALVTITASGGGGGIPEAPSDSKNYARRNATWADLDSYYLNLSASNDPLTGQLSITPGNAGGGVYVTLGAGGSFSNYYGFYLNRVGSTSYSKYAIRISDDEVHSHYNYVAGTLEQYDYNGDTLIDWNPYCDPTSTMLIASSVNAITAAGKLFELQNQGVDKFTVFGDGVVNIPTGKTYNINGSPHTHTGLGDWVLIEDKLLGADTETIDFQNIPSTYKHLVIKGRARLDSLAAGGASMYVVFNNDTTAGNYDSLATVLYPTNAVYTSEDLSSGFGQIAGTNTNGDLANAFSAFTIDIPGYSLASGFKSYVSSCFLVGTASAGTTRVFYCGGTWESQSAISRITFSRGAGVKYKQNTRLSLYGLK